MKKYISNGTWFDRGTECFLVADCSSKEIKMGIFAGIRTCKNSSAEGGMPVGTKYQDEELCSYDEFVEDMKDLDRKFFGKPMRDISLEYHPYKKDIDGFKKFLIEAAEGFAINMKNLPVGKKSLFVEEWMETFLAWSEIEQKPERIVLQETRHEEDDMC